MKRFSLLVAVSLACLLLSALAAAGQEKRGIEIKPALLVIDIQNAYVPHMSAEDRDTVLENINKLIALFREHDLPVIRVYHTDPGKGPEPGTEPFEFPKTVAIKDSDERVIKNYPSAFKKTDLEKMLHEESCNAVFLCGLSATGCVLATYYGARDRDIISVMVEDAVLSPKVSYTRVIEEICATLTLKEVEDALEEGTVR